MSELLPAAGSGQPQAQRFNQPISFVSSGTVGTDPMEIRPALIQASSTPAHAAVDTRGSGPSTAAATAGAPADDTAMHWASSGAQLQHALQVTEQPLASISTQAHTPGETLALMPCVFGCVSVLRAPTCLAALMSCVGPSWAKRLCLVHFTSFVMDHPCAVATGAAEIQPESHLSASEAPWNALEPASSGAHASSHPGLGCAALPDFDYPEDSHAGLGSQDATRPLYDR